MSEKRKTRGPQVKDTEVEVLIGTVYRKHPKWKAPMVRNEVSFLLRKDNPQLPAGWPSLSAVQKVLALVRKNASKLPEDPEDKPWSMATLDRPDIPPIPPEALPAVLNVWKLRIDSEEWNFSFSIREAKWAARLSALMPDLIPDIETLSTRASQYARTEILYQLIGRPFDSRGLDSLLMGRFGEDAARDFTGELM